MARTDLSVWVPEQQGSTVLQTIATNSAVDAKASHETMNSDTKTVGVVNGVSVSIVAKGSAYPEDATADAEVILQSRKFGTAFRFAEEDLADAPANIIAQKQNEWAKAFAVLFDNACLGTTAAKNGTTVPFDSVYRIVSNSTTASGNLIKTASGAAVTYDNLSAALGKVEGGSYFGDAVIIAHPAFKNSLRGIKDTAGNPIFIDANTGNGQLFGYDLVWSKGARTSAVATNAPTGSPLLVIVSREYLLVGDRLGVESQFAPAGTGPAMLTDEALLKVRTRKAFSFTTPEAAAIVELVP